MKSSIKTLTEFRELPMQWEVDLTCPQEHLEKELRQVVRPYKKTVDSERIEKGDVVLLKLESSLPRFNKSMVPVTVGGELYDAELEQQLIGRSLKESFTATVQDASVAVTVLKISRTVYPAPTDEMVAAYCPQNENYEGIATLEAFRQRVADNYRADRRQEAVYEKMQYLLEKVMTTTDFDFDEEEMQALSKRLLRESKEEAGDSDMSDEELAAKMGVPSAEVLHKELVISCHWQIAPALWVAHENGLDAAQLELGDERLYNYDFLENYVRAHIIYKEDV